MQELRDRVAVVTGGASGIGRGMAQAFAAEGMKLVLADIEKPPLERTVAELAGTGADVIGAICDVSDPASVDALRDRALDQFGAVHVLCNNAGVSGSSLAPLWEAPLDEWEWVMGVNVMGVVHGYRSFVPVMIEQRAPGHVVNTASMAGLIHGAGIYGMTKHAVVSLSEGLFSQLRGLGLPIGVSVLCPGWVRTNIMESERNRPEAPRPAPGASAAQAEAILGVIKGLVQAGLDPLEVGRLVVRAIRDERFYVLTHPTWDNMIRNRMQRILDGLDPTPVPPANEPLWPQPQDQ
jgi:NAD(P)-dependent dehydrogenase (short-subunit alcohol dehydrogenase family)